MTERLAIVRLPADVVEEMRWNHDHDNDLAFMPQRWVDALVEHNPAEVKS